MQFAKGGIMGGDLTIEGNVSITGILTGGGILNKKIFTIGNNIDNEFIISHNLNTKDIIVNLYDKYHESIIANFKNISLNETLITFGAIIDTNSIKVVIVG